MSLPRGRRTDRLQRQSLRLDSRDQRGPRRGPRAVQAGETRASRETKGICARPNRRICLGNGSSAKSELESRGRRRGLELRSNRNAPTEVFNTGTLRRATHAERRLAWDPTPAPSLISPADITCDTTGDQTEVQAWPRPERLKTRSGSAQAARQNGPRARKEAPPRRRSPQRSRHLKRHDLRRHYLRRHYLRRHCRRLERTLHSNRAYLPVT